MTDTAAAPRGDVTEDGEGGGDGTRNGARDGNRDGKLTIFHATIAPALTPEEVADRDLSSEVDRFDYSPLLESHSEDEVRDGLAEWIRAVAPGVTITTLFAQRGMRGASLLHVWFGPHFPLYRHSHPGLGDCLYYVVSGQAILGSQVLEAGDGFFVPSGMAYKYRAGPEGVEVLEFRVGNGTEGAPAIKVDETSLEELNRLTAVAKEHQHEWVPPTAITERPLTTRH